MTQIGEVGSINGNIKIPRDYAMGGVLVGIPSFGMYSCEFANNLLSQSPPINFSMVYATPKYVRWDWQKNEPRQETHPVLGRQIPVDEARNILAFMAIQNNFGYVFFRDDDVLCQPDTINRLFSRNADVIAAPYWSKQKPPHSLILLESKLAGYEDFEFGDLVQCMATGMGATLIKTDVFKKIEPPWFKTVHGIEMNDIQDIAPHCGRMTEDVYFCKKAAAKGYKILVDTAVPAAHQDFKSDTLFMYNTELKIAGWQEGANPAFFFIPRADYKQEKPVHPEQVTEPVKLDMGGGRLDQSQPDWKRVDLDPAVQPDLVADMRDVVTIKSKFPNITEIRCRESFEHLDPTSHAQCLAAWRRLLPEGGRLTVQVPDLIWCCQHVVEHQDDDYEDVYNAMARVFGHVSGGPHFGHKWGFTEKSLRQLAEAAGFEVTSIEHHEGREGDKPDGRLIQMSLVLNAVARQTGPSVDPENLVLQEGELCLT